MCSWARTRAALLAHVGAFGLHAVRALQPLPPSWPSAQVACPPAWIRWLAPEVLAGDRHTLASVSARSCSGREPWTILSLVLPPAALPAPGTDWSVTLPLLPLQDVFSYAVILWELMTFNAPWEGMTNLWQVRKPLGGARGHGLRRSRL